MDGATLQSRVNNGYAKAAAHIGLPHDQYRGTPSDPLQSASRIATLPASFNINGSFAGQVKEQQIIWQCIADAAQLQVGDYLVGPRTFAIVTMDPMLPTLALLCPDTVTITRAAQVSGYGAIGYQDAGPAPITVARNMPAYLNLKRETGRTDTRLPGDAGMRGFYALYCWLADGTIHDRDIVTDQNGNRYQVTAANFGPLGWQCLCERLEA